MNKVKYITISIHKTKVVPFPPPTKYRMFQCITRPTHRRTDANLYPPERQLTKASEPSFDLEGGAKGQILTSEDSQPTISCKLVSHCKTSRINNKRVTNPFKFGCPRLTLKEGLTVKSDHIIRFPAHDFL